jgi:hypothetical protein
VCKCTDSSCVNGNACDAGECKCGSAPACTGTQTVAGTADTFPYCRGSASSACQGNGRDLILTGGICTLSGGNEVTIDANADAESALMSCASACAAIDSCDQFITLSPTSNSPITGCRVGVGGNFVVGSCTEAGHLTVNLYSTIVDSTKAASAPISCTKLVHGSHSHIECTTKPLH